MSNDRYISSEFVQYLETNIFPNETKFYLVQYKNSSLYWHKNGDTGYT